MTRAYTILDAAVNGVPATSLGFTQLAAPRPYELGDAAIDGARARYKAVHEFFNSALDVLAAALEGEYPPNVGAMLLSEVPSDLGAAFHRRILARRRTIPQFFRTDEVRPGRIVEIQCPGSLWGEYEALRFQYAEGGYTDIPSVAASFTDQVRSVLGPDVRIHHLLDNASISHTMKYFIHRTRPAVRYWGIDPGIDQLSCNFVRSHSFFGQIGECFFSPRLEQYAAGELMFDLPPVIIFDEKITLALPFLEETRSQFSDDVRGALVFSAPVTPDGFRMPDGDWISLEAFASQPRTQRRWFLKYAGSDTFINWGSRAVFTLDNCGKEACFRRLSDAASGFHRGKVWIVQPSETMHDIVQYVTRDGRVQSARLNAKFSTFYGPNGYMASLTQHRNFPKVHGQQDTVVNIGIGTYDRLESDHNH